jgi:hypothetical protein
VEGRYQWKGIGCGERVIWCENCIDMYVNVKMVSVETIPGMGGGGIKRAVKGANSSVIYMVHSKNFVNPTVYPHPAQ